MTLVSEMLARHAAGKMQKPCDVATRWLGDETDWQRAWGRCPRGDWQLWAAREYGLAPSLAWTAREIVSYAFNYAAQAFDRAKLIDHAAEMRRHRDALREATDATVAGLLAAAKAAGYAAKAAGYAAARAAWDAGDAKAAEAAARAAGDAAGDAARAAARDAEHRRCADAVRELWPAPPWLAGVER
jgi:hypothetical protein